MDSLPEVLVVSDSENENTNCSVYDLKTGGLITTFKEGNSVRHGLVLIADDYIISAFKRMPAVKVWELCNDDKRESSKMHTQGYVSCLAVTNCGMYCAAGINTSIHVWELATGNLLNKFIYHSQTVTCLQFSSDGSHLISGGNDGMVLVWLLSQAVASNESSNDIRPHFRWMDHAAEVTDIFVGSISFYARVATASIDMTCRLYELESGILLTTVRVDHAITAVTMDEAEYFLILGSAEGDIFRINLFSDTDAEVHYKKSDWKCSFVGHKKGITCLAVSSSGKILVSGSEDHDCRLWDMTNFTCIKKIPCQGPVTNAFITPYSRGLTIERKDFVPRIRVNALKKEYEEGRSEAEGKVIAKIKDSELSLFHHGSPDEYFDARVLNQGAAGFEDASRGRNMEDADDIVDPIEINEEGSEEHRNRQSNSRSDIPPKKIKVQKNSETVIEMEIKKLQFLADIVKACQSENDDLLFFRSILPHVSKIPTSLKLRFRSRIQEIVEEFACY